MIKEEIVENIKKSKKYRAVYIKTIERIVADCIVRFGEKRAEKEAKNLLYQVWGAFYTTRPDFSKILNKIKIETEKLQSTDLQNADLKKIILPILQLQSSAQERVEILEEFYKKIFEITGAPSLIIDQACALNPLTIPWMALPENVKYLAYDIDEEQTKFLNDAFNLLGIKNAKAETKDILSDNFDYADVVFMFKLLPCLDHQKKKCSLEILKAQKCKFMVISFPIKSIGGKEKGMTEFYRNSFKLLIEKENWKVSELLFESELVFVVQKR